MLTPTAAAVKFALPFDPRASRLARRTSTKGSSTFWNVVEYAATRRRSAATDSSGRGDHLSESLGDRALAAPGVLGHGRYGGRWSDPHRGR